jgi:HD-like signal output (HDOD) protein
MSLAKDWSLPEILHDPIARHHEPEQANKHPELTALVYLADLIYSRFVMGQELERMNTDGIAFSLKVLNIRQTQLPALIDEVCLPFHGIN